MSLNQHTIRIFPTTLCISFGLFYLWDFYLQGVGIRIFDVFGIMSIAVAVIVAGLFPNCSVGFVWKKVSLLYLFVGLILLLVISGICQNVDNAKAGFGCILGVIIFILYYGANLQQERVLKLVNVLIVMGAIYLGVQTIWFYLSGNVVNLQSFLGAENRGSSSQFRPTGIFLEPAGYCISTMMLLSLKMRLKRCVDFVVYLALASMVVSLSMWGFISSIVFLAIYKRSSFIFWLILAVAVGVVAQYIDFEGTLFKSKIIDRAENLAEVDDAESKKDVSSETRYGKNRDVMEKTEPIEYFFGKGISNWDLIYGFNGFSFIVTAGGYFGGLLFFLLILRLMSPRWSLETLLMILLCMTAWSIWTHMYWWAWLALLLRQYSSDKNFVSETV